MTTITPKRIKKLRNLINHERSARLAGFTGEADNFASLIDRLREKYGYFEHVPGTVHHPADDEEKNREYLFTSDSPLFRPTPQPWENRIFESFCAHFGCRLKIVRHNNIKIVIGTPDNRRRVRESYFFITSQMTERADEFASRILWMTQEERDGEEITFERRTRRIRSETASDWAHIDPAAVQEHLYILRRSEDKREEKRRQILRDIEAERTDFFPYHRDAQLTARIDARAMFRGFRSEMVFVDQQTAAADPQVIKDSFLTGAATAFALELEAVDRLIEMAEEAERGARRTGCFSPLPDHSDWHQTSEPLLLTAGTAAALPSTEYYRLLGELLDREDEKEMEEERRRQEDIRSRCITRMAEVAAQIRRDTARREGDDDGDGNEESNTPNRSSSTAGQTSDQQQQQPSPEPELEPVQQLNIDFFLRARKETFDEPLAPAPAMTEVVDRLDARIVRAENLREWWEHEKRRARPWLPTAIEATAENVIPRQSTVSGADLCKILLRELAEETSIT